MSIISLEKLLKSGTGGRLEKVVQAAQDMDRLTSAIQAGLAPPLAENVVAASLRPDGELIVVASSSAWAAKLRFEEIALMGVVRDTGADVNRCRITVSRQRT